jgi:RNA polymerase sigma-70 factor (ECF subfamily)
MTEAGSAAALHRRATGIDAFFEGEEAARAGRDNDAEALFSTASRYGVGGDEGDDPLAADVASARAGDRVSAERLLRAIRPFVEAVCRVRLGRTDVGDRAREISLAVLAALPDDGDLPVLEFAHAMTLRTLKGHRHTEQGALLQIQGLPAKQRDIIVLRIFFGMSAERTAEIVGSTPGAVRVAFHRALARLASQTERVDARISRARRAAR